MMRSLFVRKFTAVERMEHRDKLAALTKRALASDQVTDSDDVEFGGGQRKDVRSASRTSSDVAIGAIVGGEQHLLISSTDSDNAV
uniref:Uncharacterized protein n=1 Tax=Caenorhabditis japonica TaxID=281687 RepID=A0A8R1IQ58_CAEJA